MRPCFREGCLPGQLLEPFLLTAPTHHHTSKLPATVAKIGKGCVCSMYLSIDVLVLREERPDVANKRRAAPRAITGLPDPSKGHSRLILARLAVHTPGPLTCTWCPHLEHNAASFCNGAQLFVLSYRSKSRRICPMSSGNCNMSYRLNWP